MKFLILTTAALAIAALSSCAEKPVYPPSPGYQQPDPKFDRR